MFVLGGALNTALSLALVPLMGLVLELLVAIYFIHDLHKPERQV
jgi:hypothetical protein